MRTIKQDLIPGLEERGTTPRAISDGFDPARLTQARRLAEMTKKDVANALGVTPAAVGQYETGVSALARTSSLDLPKCSAYLPRSS